MVYVFKEQASFLAGNFKNMCKRDESKWKI